jgi:hypothetical protein
MRKRRRTRPGDYRELRLWASTFADAQAARVAFEAKDRSSTVDMEASSFDEVIELYKEAEARLDRELVACYKATVPAPVQRWQEEAAGIGDHTLALLLGITGDPRTALPRHWEGEGTGRHLVDDPARDRTVDQLWQYCGHGAPKNREVKGNAAALLANGSPGAKRLVHLMAQAQVKTNAKGGARYRPVYDREKAKYAGKTHSVPCTGGYSGTLYVKCKTHVPNDTTLVTDDEVPANILSPKLGYAQAGDPYQPSHLHAIALRHTGKEILRDLWLTAGGDAPVYGARRAGEERSRGHGRRPRP